MKYAATLGLTSILITGFISLLLGSVIAFFAYRAFVTIETAEALIEVIVIMCLLSLYGLFYLYRPQCYILDNDGITIKRPVKDVKISLSDIVDAYKIRKESMQWLERDGGNGGFFGFYGNFKNSLGEMTWYATKRKNYVLIETSSKEKIILTPDDINMVREIRKLIGK
jgi:hypothetical protein